MKGYKKLVARCQRMIAGVTKAENMEREKEHIKQKNILGYDPEKWVPTKANLVVSGVVSEMEGLPRQHLH